MTNLIIENFTVVSDERTSTNDNWEIGGIPGRYLSAICYSTDRLCRAKFLIDENGYEFSIVSLDRNDRTKVFRVLKDIEKKTNTYNGCGKIRLSGGPVSKRWGSYDTPVLSDFKTKYEITKVKRLRYYAGFLGEVNEVEELNNKSFIVANSELGSTKLYIPEGNDARYITKSGSLFVTKNISGPGVIEPIDRYPKICIIKNIKNFFIFEKTTPTGNHQRTLYMHPYAKIFDIERDIEKILNN